MWRGNPILLFLSFGLARGRVDFAELYELLVVCFASEGDEGALVGNVAAFDADEITVFAELTHDAQTLRAAGKATDQGRGAFVFAPAYFYACCSHNVSERYHATRHTATVWSG